MRNWIIALVMAPFAATAQDLPFSIVHTEACTQEAIGYGELKNCIGASANQCMDTPIGGSTVGMTGCMDRELAYWDGWLNTHYQELRARERARDAEWGEPVKRADALRDMQRAWIAFRDTTCDYERAQWGGGTGGGPATLACLLRLTGEQALYLRSMLEEY